MDAIVRSKLKHLVPLCKKRGVQRLALFGSAAAVPIDPATSDLDLVVEFKPMPPAAHADSYFGLMEDLEKLFGIPVDLVEPGPIRNPFFRQVVQETQVVLYEAKYLLSLNT